MDLLKLLIKKSRPLINLNIPKVLLRVNFIPVLFNLPNILRMTRIKILMIALMIGKFGYSQLTFTVTSSTGAFSLSCSVPLLSMFSASNFSSNVSFLWSTPSQGTLITNNLSVWNDPGIYTVTATSGSLVSTQTISVTMDRTAPSVSVASTINSITCVNYSFVLSAVANPTHVAYSWIEPGIGFACTTNTCIGWLPGNYGLIVTNPQNGCKDTAKITIHDGRGYPFLESNRIFTIACPGGTVDLVPALNSPTAGLTFTWNAPANANTSATNNLILNTDAPGTYTLAVLNTLNGCRSRMEISVYACVGLKEESIFVKRLFPNPFRDIINIDYSSQMNSISVQVINILGQTVYEATYSHSPRHLDLSMLSKGMYYVRIMAGKDQDIVKVLKE